MNTGNKNHPNIDDVLHYAKCITESRRCAQDWADDIENLQAKKKAIDKEIERIEKLKEQSIQGLSGWMDDLVKLCSKRGK